MNSKNNIMKHSFATDKKYIQNISKESFLLLSWLCIFYAQVVARFVLHRIGLDKGTLRETILFLVASLPLILFFIWRSQIKREKYEAFGKLFVGIVLLIVVTAILNPAVRPFLFRQGYGLDRVIRPDAPLYAFLFFSLVDDPEELLTDLRLFAYTKFLYLLVMEILPALKRGYWLEIGPSGKDLQLSYSLTFGYSMVLPTLIFIYFAMRHKNIIDFLLALAGGYFIITEGNRGALILIYFFLVLMGISSVREASERKKKIQEALKTLVRLCVIFCTMMFVIPGISNMMSRGENSEAVPIRNVEKIKEGKITETNGRKEIWQAEMQGMKEDGHIWGFGFFGDRPYVTRVHFVGHSHNLMVELVMSFGIFGVLIILTLIVVTIRMIFICDNQIWRECFIIMFSVAAQLLMSRSFWYIMEFWATLSIVYTYKRLYNKRLFIK